MHSLIKATAYLTVYLVLWGGSIQAHGAELAPFDAVRAQYKANSDGTRLSYLFNRCAALDLNVTALLARQGQKKGAQDFENLAQHYMVLSEANEREMDKKRGIKSVATMKTVSRSVATLSELYSKRMQDNYVKNGDFLMGDAQLEREVAECNLPDVFTKKAVSN
jgi:hypothetical protein